MTNQSGEEPICCPKFDPLPWDDQIVEWDNKKFICDHVYTFFYMPLNFGGVMKRLNKVILSAGGRMQDNLCLSDHRSKWRMDLYLSVDKEIAGVENIELNGKYYCKVYEGPFRDTEKWCKDFELITKSRRFNTGKLYMWYTTCPRCVKKYGKNFVVILAKVE